MNDNDNDKKATKSQMRLFTIALIAVVVLFSVSIASSLSKCSKNPQSDTARVDSIALDIDHIDFQTGKSEETIVKIDSAKIKELKPLFREKTDEFEDATWVKHKNSPRYDNVNAVFAYFQLEDGKPTNFRMREQYAAEDWLFIQQIIFLIDGERFEYTPLRVERDNNTSIWEWTDEGVASDEMLRMIVKNLAKAKEAKIRYVGRQYHDDRKLRQSEIKAIKETYEYYTALGGKM